jgi:light-regulated signal transduction histidine kinase (bacteriophytochrome)
MPMVTGNRDELVRLFQNLVANAIKYRHPDRHPIIRVNCDHCQDGWQFAVEDNGIGIAHEYFERIFWIFQRLHTREKYEGTGIGLAICKKIVEFHGGHIWVESDPDHGSVFRFTIPDTGATEPAEPEMEGAEDNALTELPEAH